MMIGDIHSNVGERSTSRRELVQCGPQVKQDLITLLSSIQRDFPPFSKGDENLQDAPSGSSFCLFFSSDYYLIGSIGQLIKPTDWNFIK